MKSTVKNKQQAIKHTTNTTHSTQSFTTAALTGLMAISAVMLGGCSNSQVVNCQHINSHNPNQQALMHKGMCLKVGGSKVGSATAADLKSFKGFSSSSYIKCYGIAASGKNDCGTKSSACAGTAKTSRAKDAWIAFPRSLCIKAGGVVVEPQKKG